MQEKLDSKKKKKTKGKRERLVALPVEKKDLKTSRKNLQGHHQGHLKAPSSLRV